VDFLIELFIFVRSRWKFWLRPIVILLLLIGLLLLVDLIMERPSSPEIHDPRIPFSRDHYRHDVAFFNK
jgi:hypothetical protein